MRQCLMLAVSRHWLGPANHKSPLCLCVDTKIHVTTKQLSSWFVLLSNMKRSNTRGCHVSDQYISHFAVYIYYWHTGKSTYLVDSDQYYDLYCAVSICFCSLLWGPVQCHRVTVRPVCARMEQSRAAAVQIIRTVSRGHSDINCNKFA